ncbi:DUF1844 domain-containing protein [candidate division WOR-3 bacterium]|nr:DUF1844 domain-containing protein [candidate division WOR-3 bacterium]
MGNNDNTSFLKLVLFVSTGAYQSMGMIENPISKKSEINLEVTKQMIEFLDVIKEKTVNNLGKNELDMLNQSIYDIKVNFMKIERDENSKTEKGDKKDSEDSKESKNSKNKTKEK